MNIKWLHLCFRTDNIVMWLGIEWKVDPGKERGRNRKQIMEENDNWNIFLKNEKGRDRREMREIEEWTEIMKKLIVLMPGLHLCWHMFSYYIRSPNFLIWLSAVALTVPLGRK